MKLREGQTLYVRSMGKALQVTAICDSVEEANRHCELHANDAVVAEFGPYIFLADKGDRGTRMAE